MYIYIHTYMQDEKKLKIEKQLFILNYFAI